MPLTLPRTSMLLMVARRLGLSCAQFKASLFVYNVKRINDLELVAILLVSNIDIEN